MSFFAQATDVFARIPSWALLGVAVTFVTGVVIRIAVVKVRKARKANSSAHEHAVLGWCAAHGHAYGIHNTGWRCGVCGNYVARREGERYGRPEEGFVDRRREERRAA